MEPGGAIASLNLSRQLGSVGFATVLLAVGMLLRDRTLAWRYGANDVADVFQLAIQVPGFILIALNSAFSGALLPRFMLAHQSGETNFLALVARCHREALVLAIAIGLVLFVTAPFLAGLLAPGFDAARLNNLSEGLAWLAAATSLGIMAAFWSAVLQALRLLASPIYVSVLVPGATATFVIMSEDSLPLVPFIGTVIGFLAQMAVLCWIGAQKGLDVWPRRKIDIFNFVGPQEFRGELLYALAGTVLMALVPLLAFRLLTDLGPGAVASFAYATAIVTAVLGLALKVISLPLMSTYANLVVKKQFPQLEDMIRSHARWAQIGGGLAALVIIGFAPWVVQHVFVGGQFGVEEAQIVELLLAILALQLPWHISGSLLARAISAVGRNRGIFQSGAVNLAFFAVMGTVLASLLGSVGVAIAQVLMCIVAHYFNAWRFLNALKHRIDERQ
jgi:putative peptidoglycan lipid II flippase